ncbi:MAG: hypothetical protein BWK76_27625 [Desulfobulbaceae bacterium A2]|nr:MAG: hypothetical protein BWK76_27625 [Desulfobulbaceae bacterium A2]
MTLQIAREQILLDLKATTREEVLAELAAAAQGRCPQLSRAQVADLLLERELQESTGHGNGIAIPHATLELLDETVLLFGRSRRGINFYAADKRPVHLFVTILIPHNTGATYLRTLARVSRLLQQPTLRDRLLLAASAAEVQEIFAQPA